MTLTLEQKSALAKNIFACAGGWVSFESLTRFCEKYQIAHADKAELLTLIKRITGAKQAQIVYRDGHRKPGLLGIQIAPDLDATEKDRWGQPWEVYSTDGKRLTFNQNTCKWE